MRDLPAVNMFWHGPRLGDVHAACLRSFLRQGHHVILHGYDPPDDLPDGVETLDAATIMPFADLISHDETGSIAVGVDRYRYRLLQAGMGLYCDCDVYCLRPIEDADYIFGREDRKCINNAVLKYPAGGELAAKLVAETADEHYIPDWCRRRDKYLMRARRLVGLYPSVRKQPWGFWGPILLTHWIEKLGLAALARPIDHFYPLHYLNSELLSEPGLRIEDLATPRSFAIHLCHQAQAREAPPPGSPLRQIIETA